MYNPFPMYQGNEDDILRSLFGENGAGINSSPSPFGTPQSPIMGGASPATAVNNPGGGAAPDVQQVPIPQMQSGGGPKVIKRNQPQPAQGGGGMKLPMPSMGMMKGFMGGGSGGGGMLSGILGGGGGASGGAGGGGMLSGLFSNPWTAIPAAAVVGAGSLSADSAAAGTGANVENWLGPLYNIPEAMARGDWDDVMKDGAMGPVGLAYNLINGKDFGKSLANSLGPLGQVPYLLFNGELPYSGGKSSKRYMDAFQGRGI